MQRTNLETFAGGALQEKFDDAMQKVLQNMLDPNTPYRTSGRLRWTFHLSRMRTGRMSA